MNLFKSYRNAVIYPSLIMLILSIIYLIIKNYNNEWEYAKSVFQMSILPLLFFALLICLLSTKIFLNKLEKLNKNLIWNILTWFLLPFIYILIILIHDIENRIKYEFEFGSGFLYILITTIPYVISLCWTFIKYNYLHKNAVPHLD